MSISAVSPLPRYVEPNPVIVDPRLQSNEGEGNSCWTTAMKIAGIIAAVIASIASFVYLGPLVGLVITLVLGTGALLIFNSCCGSVHDHPRNRDDAYLHTPWYQRLFNFIPIGGAYAPQHVPVRGHEPHVPVGHDHVSPSAHRPWYEGLGNWFSFIPSGVREMNDGAHVQVGRGNGRGGGNVQVGRGHNPPNDPHAHGRGRGGPTSVPPPTGPFGHVSVGRGRNY